MLETDEGQNTWNFSYLRGSKCLELNNEALVAAREGIKKFIEHYNYHRPHQALGYKTPSQMFFGC